MSPAELPARRVLEHAARGSDVTHVAHDAQAGSAAPDVLSNLQHRERELRLSSDANAARYPDPSAQHSAEDGHDQRDRKDGVAGEQHRDGGENCSDDGALRRVSENDPVGVPGQQRNVGSEGVGVVGDHARPSSVRELRKYSPLPAGASVVSPPQATGARLRAIHPSAEVIPIGARFQLTYLGWLVSTAAARGDEKLLAAVCQMGDQAQASAVAGRHAAADQYLEIARRLLVVLVLAIATTLASCSDAPSAPACRPLDTLAVADSAALIVRWQCRGGVPGRRA